MSHIVAQPQSDNDPRKITDNVEEPDSSFKISQQDQLNWQQEIDHRKVKDAADLQMMKNQKRRSDLNLRLSKQIQLSGSESSPMHGDNAEILQNTNTNRANIHENLSSYRKSLLPEKNSSQARQVNLFGEAKEQRQSSQNITTPNKSGKHTRSRSPPNNDGEYNLDGESSDNNLKYNQNHKIVE